MTTPLDNLVPLTGNALIDGLTWGAAWQFNGAARTLTYSLSLNDTSYMRPAWTSALADAARLALTAWSNVANLTFVESGSGTIYTRSPADIALILTGTEIQSATSGAVGLGIPPSPTFGDTMLTALGETRATYPHPEGDVALDNYYYGFGYLNPGGIGLTLMLHEIGHALGLKHTDDDSSGKPTFASLGISNLDSNLHTVMSYHDVRGDQVGSNPVNNAATPMPLDILAMQRIYGANTTYHAGNDTYTFTEKPPQAWTIWDAGGIDTLATGSVNQYNNVTLDLREGHFTQSPTMSGMWLAIAYGAVIENAIGGDGNDTLIGNAANNRLDGGLGSDSMAGGSGNDTYAVNATGDVITELPGQGTDDIIASVSYTLPDNVDNLTLSGTLLINGVGNGLDNILTGNAANNSLSAGAGNDYLDGSGGVDNLQGGAGNDTYVASQTLAGTPNTLELLGEPGASVFNGTASNPLTVQPNFSLNDQTGDGLIDVVTVLGTVGQSINYRLTIETSQLGQNLVPGNYLNAERALVASPGHAGLDFGYSGNGSNQVFGSFSVAAIDIDYSGIRPLLQRLALRFEIHSESPAAPATTGSFNYNYFGDGAAAAAVIELPNDGIDEVRASVSYTLPDNVENLSLTGLANVSGIGNALANAINGNGGNNLLNGGEGNDTLIAGMGNDTLIGGTGSDVAQYSGMFRQYQLTGTAIATATLAGPDGTDSLSGIEKLVFMDGSMHYDPYAHVAQVSRLYETTLGRLPDSIGLNDWTARLDAGTALPDVALGFTGSQEFLITYGSLDTTQFVNQLYLNVLDRPADPGGLSNWVSYLNGGATRGDVIVGFSESQENINNHAAQTSAGIWEINETAGTVARLYWGTLARAPDSTGLENWVNALNGGMSLGQVAGGFTGSQEFQNVYGSLNNTQFVNQLYLNVLERPADPGGLAYWLNALDGGTSRGDIAWGFTESTEYQIKMIGMIDHGISIV